MTVFSHLPIFRHLWFLSFLFRRYIGRKCLFLAVFGCVIYLGFTTIAWFTQNRETSVGDMQIKTATLPFDIATKGASVRNQSVINSEHSEYVEGTSGTYSNPSGKYIELGNKQNLISLIGSSSSSFAATLQVNFDMVYAADDLSTQFPKRDTTVNAQSVIGTNVIGYSKISSTVEGAANSATYDKETDTELYYTTSESTASLKYNVEETPRNATALDLFHPEPFSYQL